MTETAATTPPPEPTPEPPPPTTTTPPTTPRRPSKLFGHRLLDALVLSLAVVLTTMYFWPRVVVFVKSGEAGVIWRTYAGGTDETKIYGEGIHVIAPWNEFFVYNVRLQQVTRSYDLLTKDGLHVDVVVSARFRPKGAPFPWEQRKEKALAELHKTVGPDYVNVLVVPEISSSLRRVMENFEIDQVYTDRGALERQVQDVARRELDARYIELDALLVESVSFPPAVRTAIEGKLMEEQSNYRYDYVLQKEAKEAQRKRIEAAGVRDFQRIISAGLTDQYLRWKSIEAMVQISKSENSKLVIIGGKEGVPVIVNAGQDNGTTAPAAAAAAPPPGTPNNEQPVPTPPTLPPPPPPPP